MVNIVVLLISAGCAAAAFYKGTIVRAFAAIIAAVCAVMVAFNYFEALTGTLGFLGSWGRPFGFVLLAVLVFVLLMAAVFYLTRNPIDFGFLPELIGRSLLGFILGLVLSGFLLTVLAMSPLPTSFPYSRFDRANQTTPDKLLLNVDGFVTGLFSTVSSGSFRGAKSFDSKFLDQLYLERFNTTAGNQRTGGASTNQQGRGGTQEEGEGRGSTRGGRGGRGERGNTRGERGGRGFDGQRGDMQ